MSLIERIHFTTCLVVLVDRGAPSCAFAVVVAMALAAFIFLGQLVAPVVALAEDTGALQAGAMPAS